MATLQIRIDDHLKKDSDALFSSLGLDTPTAVRMFLTAAQVYRGFPFPISQHPLSSETAAALEDARLGKNLYGPYATAEDAMKEMLED